MISFRKHAPESTRRPDSLLARRGLHVKAASNIALLIVLLLAASPAAAYVPRQKQQAGNAARSAQSPAPAAQESAEVRGEEGLIPIRVMRVETPDGPGFVATIGEFPADLNEAGQEFLKQEFFEHFASDVLGLVGPDTRETLKVSLLPQEKENQREGDFISGKISGHMVVLVERRRVFVACTLSESVSRPSPLAALERFAATALAAV